MRHATPHLEFIYQPGASDFLVVTFNPINIQANGTSFWGDKYFRDHRISALGFVSTRPNWFPSGEMEQLIALAKPILQKYRHICTYGSSMGGYGAIKYSGRLGAQTVVAFSPQHSIDPKDERYPSQYSAFYNAELNHDVAIRADDLAGDIFLFYDPHHQVDAYAAGHIAGLSDRTNLVRMPYIGHTTIIPVAKARQGLKVLQLAMTGRAVPLQRLARKLQRESPLRPHHLACALAARHPRTAFAIADRWPENFAWENLDNFCKALKQAGQAEAAITWLKTRLAKNPGDTSAYKNLALLLKDLGDQAEAKEHLLQAAELAPRDPVFPQLLSKLHLARRDFEEALRWATRAVELDPQNPAVYQNQVYLLKRTGRHDLAAEVVRKWTEVKRVRQERVFLPKVTNRVSRTPSERSIPFIRPSPGRLWKSPENKTLRAHHLACQLAARRVRNAFAIADRYPEAFAGESLDHFCKALRLARQIHPAIAWLRTYVVNNPTSPGGWKNLSLHLQVVGALEEAEAPMLRATELAPQDPKYALMLSKLLAASGKTDKALAWAARAVELAPDQSASYHYHAALLNKAGQGTRATEVLQACAARIPAQRRGIAPAKEALHRSLNLRLDFHRATRREIGLLAQLTRTATQFNLTGRQRSRDEFGHLRTLSQFRIYSLGVADKFDDYGLAGLAVIELAADRPDWVIDSFLLNRRAMGRGVESTFLSLIAAEARKAGTEYLWGTFSSTGKNTPSAAFLPDHGFAFVHDTAQWCIPVSQIPAVSSYITVHPAAAPLKPAYDVSLAAC